MVNINIKMFNIDIELLGVRRGACFSLNLYPNYNRVSYTHSPTKYQLQFQTLPPHHAQVHTVVPMVPTARNAQFRASALMGRDTPVRLRQEVVLRVVVLLGVGH